MTSDYQRFTYRELGERLGVTPDAARMRAKREAAAGRWNIVRGSHPQDVVHIDVPAAEAAAMARASRGRNKRAAPLPLPDSHPSIHPASGSPLALAHEFATQLSAEKDRHRDTAVQLAAATAKIECLAAELARLNAERGPR